MQSLCKLGVAGVLALGVVLAGQVRAAPDEEALGKRKGYPWGTAETWFYDEGVRIGSFSNLDRVLPHNRLAKAATALTLPAAAEPLQLTYRFGTQIATIDDFLARNRITGLLIVKDGTVRAERYQYDRKPTHRFVSHSMAKSITSLAVGMALQEGRIKSLDDPVSRYVPALAGNPFGDASIRNVLRMSSGVAFKEIYDRNDDLHNFTMLRARRGVVEAIKAFANREAPQGTRFHYATIETHVLAAVMKAATGMTLSDYLTPRLWQPLGAEADALWRRYDSDGLETAGGTFSAVLRDYGRLGMLLANDGAIGGKQILPKDFLVEATDWRRHPEAFAPRKATPYFGYGYQFWTYPGEKRRFALLGVYGQSIFVDPELKLVMVITAATKTASVAKDPLARERDALWRGLVNAYGRW